MQAMQTIRRKTERNQAIEWGRLLASCLVVLLHVPLPGKAAGYLGCLTRMAVPFFFLVSGYFCYGAEGKSLARRLVHIGKLNLLAALLYILYGCLKFRYDGGGRLADYFRMVFPSWKPVWDFLLVQVNPFAGHLWYLNSLMLCQGVLLVYIGCIRNKRGNYWPLYGLGMVLLAVFFWLSTVRQSAVHYYAYRNGWLMGLPLFILGLFLGEFGGKLTRKNGSLLGIAAAGLALGFFQTVRFGMTELPVGTLIAVAALVLLLAGHPKLPSRLLGKLAGRLGTVSTAVYIVHLAVLDIYEMVLKEPLAMRMGGGEAWLRPFAVLGISLAAAVVYERGKALWLERKQKIAA